MPCTALSQRLVTSILRPASAGLRRTGRLLRYRKVARGGWVDMVFTMGPKFGAFCDLATCSDVVDRIVAAENLRAVAGKTSDPEVALGLACLARTGDAARRELLEVAMRGRPEYRPLAAVLGLTMDGVDESTVAEVIERDPRSEEHTSELQSQ